MSRDLLVQAEQELGLHGGVWPAVKALVEASLVTFGGDARAGFSSGDRGVVAVHRLTALVVCHEAGRPPGDDQVVALDTATRLLEALIDRFPLDQVSLRRDELDELTSHTEALRGHIEDPSPQLLVQADRIAGLQEEAGDLTRALPLFERTLVDRERVLGAEH